MLVKKKKICIIAFHNFENIISHCKAISNDFDLTLILMMHGDRYLMGTMDIDISNLKSGLHINQNFINEYLPIEIKKFINDKFEVWFLKTKNLKFLKDIFFSNIRTLLNAVKKINKYSFDLYHFNNTGGFIFYFLMLLKPKKFVWTLHDYKPHKGEENKKSDLFNKFISKFNLFYIQHYKFLKDEFIKYHKVNKERVYQIYTGTLDIYTYFDDKSKCTIDIPEVRYILYFGRLSKYKGVEYLIEGFNQYKLKYNDGSVKLVIAGSGKLWFDEKIILDNPDIIYFNKYLNVYEHAHLIRNCLFVVVPYIEATHSAVIMTSYAFNKPVIATNVGGLPEVVVDGKSGLLIPARDSLSICEAIKKMNNMINEINFEDNIKNINCNSEFSWNYIRNREIELFTKIINS